MTKFARKHIYLKNALILSVLLASIVSYVCIFNLMNDTQNQALRSIEAEPEKKEVSLPEVEIMKTVLEKARDVFTIMSRSSLRL